MLSTVGANDLIFEPWLDTPAEFASQFPPPRRPPNPEDTFLPQLQRTGNQGGTTLLEFSSSSEYSTHDLLLPQGRRPVQEPQELRKPPERRRDFREKDFLPDGQKAARELGLGTNTYHSLPSAAKEWFPNHSMSWDLCVNISD